MISARTARIDDNLGRGTDGSNPLPSREESANHRFLSPHACDRRRRGQGEPFGAFQCGYQPCRVLPAIGAAFPEAANNRVKVLRQMFTWACSPELRRGKRSTRIRLPLLTLLWDVEQRTLVIGECCRVEDLDTGVVVAGKRRCGTRTACLHGIVRRIEPNPEVINLHGAIGYRARL